MPGVEASACTTYGYLLRKCISIDKCLQCADYIVDELKHAADH